MDKRQYLEKVYGGLLGKCVGVRLGAPIEPLVWTYEKIQKTYGEITTYIKDYREFAADDDINGPIFFIRALLDNPSPIGAKEIGRTWLNYTREEIGFYWWGGYGRSTEHTAYLNLKAGLDAPRSGSMEVNGTTVAEQIGGQIFIDSWGWVFPGDVELSARYAGYAASVSHDGAGIDGGKFIAVCNALAFVMDDIEQIIQKALTVIPLESTYRKVVETVSDFYAHNPDDWRAARMMLESDFGYDRYAGDCHIIPNAGVCVLALLYGKGDFSRTVEIASMSGWDTDCNAGNVGSILGIMVGPENIPYHYRKPINDFHAASSVSGALNILNLPTVAKEMAILGLRQQQQSIPDNWLAGTFSNEIHLDFSLPGSSGGIRTSPAQVIHIIPHLEMNREGRITLMIDELPVNQSTYIYYKPFYTREDFDDERYSPTFTPLVFPGQRLQVSGNLALDQGDSLYIAPFVRDARSQKICLGSFQYVTKKSGFNVDWKIKDIDFAIGEVGLCMMHDEGPTTIGRLQLETFSVTGKVAFHINFADERQEFKGLSRCSLIGGGWRVEDGGLRSLTPDNFHLFTGPYYTADAQVTCTLVPEYGESHLLLWRSRGAETAYYFGLHGRNRVALLKREHDVVELASTEFTWDCSQTYSLSIAMKGSQIICLVNDSVVIETQDDDALPYGMCGVAKLSSGRTLFKSLSLNES